PTARTCAAGPPTSGPARPPAAAPRGRGRTSARASASERGRAQPSERVPRGQVDAPATHRVAVGEIEADRADRPAPAHAHAVTPDCAVIDPALGGGADGDERRAEPLPIERVRVLKARKRKHQADGV